MRQAAQKKTMTFDGSQEGTMKKAAEFFLIIFLQVYLAGLAQALTFYVVNGTWTGAPEEGLFTYANSQNGRDGNWAEKWSVWTASTMDAGHHRTSFLEHNSIAPLESIASGIAPAKQLFTVSSHTEFFEIAVFDHSTQPSGFWVSNAGLTDTLTLQENINRTSPLWEKIISFPTQISEPSTKILFLVGLLGILAVAKGKKSKRMLTPEQNLTTF